LNCTIKLADPEKSTVVKYDNNDFSSMRSELSQHGGQGTGGLLTCLGKSSFVSPATDQFGRDSECVNVIVSFDVYENVKFLHVLLYEMR